MVAFPTCFPGASIPIPADESHITALDVSSDGMVYGGTSRAGDTSVRRGYFTASTGVVFDRGIRQGREPVRRSLLRQIKVLCLRQRPGRRTRRGRGI